MSLFSAIQAHSADNLDSIARFVGTLDPDWLQEALDATGKNSIRRRKLTADKVVWLVMGMVLLADRSIHRVVEHMQICLKGLIAPSAISRARARLGSAPLQYLFGKTASVWSRDGETKWKGLSLYGVDGTHMRVDDSDVNHEHFGRPNGRTPGAYPQLRTVMLLNLATRVLAGVAVGPWCLGEVTLARDLWNHIPDRSLTIVDRGFLSYFIFLAISSEGTERFFLCRAKKNTVIHDEKPLPDGSTLAVLRPNKALCKQAPDLVQDIIVRVIHYQHPDGEPGRLMTTLLDYKKFPADEVIKVYHERWELEVTFDEIKTHMLRREECLRSKTVEGVYQEFWAILLVYNIIRREMAVVAAKKKMPVKQASFTGAMFLVFNFFLGAQTAGPRQLARELDGLDEMLGKSFFNPPRRTNRRNPRQVKIKMSQYKKTPLRHPPAAESA